MPGLHTAGKLRPVLAGARVCSRAKDWIGQRKAGLIEASFSLCVKRNIERRRQLERGGDMILHHCAKSMCVGLYYGPNIVL
jgi:hypothetical protein